MVFTAYFDESGTHAGAKVSTMAGFVGTARQWRKFEKRAGRLFSRYGVDVYHSWINFWQQKDLLTARRR